MSPLLRINLHELLNLFPCRNFKAANPYRKAKFQCEAVSPSTKSGQFGAPPVSAEMIGAEFGIGAFVLQAGNLMQTDQLLAGVVILSLFGLAVGR
jgi:hypothetical protein